MDIIIEKGRVDNIDELERLYDDLNDYLESGINYAGWKKGVYPTRVEATNGVEKGDLFVAKIDGKIVGSIILNHEPDDSYYNVKWAFDSDYSDVFVVHTFVVHPKFLKCNVGKTLMDFAEKYSMELKAKAIRLDTYENNIPAIRLYEKCGYNYVDTVDLGLGEYGLEWFKVYEKML